MKNNEKQIKELIEYWNNIIIFLYGLAPFLIFLFISFLLVKLIPLILFSLISLILDISGIIVFSKRKKNPMKYIKEHIKTNSSDSSIFYSELFDCDIEVGVEEEGVSDTYVKKCINFFQNLNSRQTDILVKKSINYYNEMKEISYLDELDMPETISDKEILKYIYPRVMWIVSDNHSENEIEFIIECGCKWDGELGLEIIVVNSEVIHVGGYDGDIDFWKKNYNNQNGNRI